MKKLYFWGGAVVVASLVAVVITMNGENNGLGLTSEEATSLTDVIVKPKPPDQELVIFIHYPKKARLGGGGGKPSCPNKKLGQWPTNNLSFSVNPNNAVTFADGAPLSPTQIVEAVALSFFPWDAASGLNPPAVSTFSGLPSSYVTETRNGVNEIAWAPLSAKGFANAIAVTFVWRNRITKEISEADMVNNDDPGFAWVNHAVVGDPDTAVVPVTGKFDLPNIDVHEFGHFVGLDHVQEVEHTMYTFSSTDEVKKRSLECGDVAGVQKIYGN